MISRHLLSLALLLPAFAVATPALAGTPKIAVVDLQRVLVSTKAGKAAKSRFEDLQKRKKKQLRRKDNQLKKQEKALMQERLALEKAVAKAGPKGITPLLKAKAETFQAKARQFQQEIVAFQQTQRQMLKDLAKKEAQLLKPIEDKIKRHIAAIATAKGYILVVSKVAVVYNLPAIDITKEVTRRMGR